MSLVLDLRTAEAAVPAELPELRGQLTGVAEGLTAAQDDLRSFPAAFIRPSSPKVA